VCLITLHSEHELTSNLLLHLVTEFNELRIGLARLSAILTVSSASPAYLPTRVLIMRIFYWWWKLNHAWC